MYLYYIFLYFYTTHLYTKSKKLIHFIEKCMNLFFPFYYQETKKPKFKNY